MAGKKPASLSAQRSDSVPSSPKHRPNQAIRPPAAGSKVNSAAKPRKNSKEKPAPSKKKRDKPEPEAGAKRKKQQAPGEAGTPKKKSKKRHESESTPQKEATSTKKQQSSSKSKNPAPTPAKKQQHSGKSAKPANKHQPSDKAEKPAAAATTPTKKQLKEDAKREKQQVPGGTMKSTPTKRQRGDAKLPKETGSPKGASSEGDAGAPTPVKKKRKDKKATVADLGTCSFPTARVRQLLRAEDDTIRASSEAVFLINKASELFLAKFVHDAYRNALKDRKKSIIYDNLSTTVCNQKCFKFLSDFVPQRLGAEDALKAAAASPS